MKKIDAAILAVIPIACATAAVSARLASGPAWLHSDVEYTYVLNALRLHERLPILFFTQPATTLAWLYAAIIHVSHAIAPVSSASLVEDVWHNPEAYVWRIHISLLVVLTGASYVAGVLVSRRARDVWAGVALQTGLILLASLALSAGLIWPETMLTVVGVVFASTLMLFVLDDGASPRLAIALGILGALGIATKATFVVAAIAPAVVSRSFRQSMVYTGALAAGTLVAIAPIWGRLPRLAGFLTGFAFRSGSYGTGTAGFDQTGYLHGAALLVRQDKLPALVLLLSVAALVVLRRFAASRPDLRGGMRALAALAVLELLQFALVARQPYPRYMIPAVLLMGVNVAIVRRIGLAWAPRRTAWALAVFLLVCSAVWLRNTESAIASARAETADRLATAEAATSLERQGATLVMGAWAASPAYALAVGQFWVGDTWSALGDDIYPGQLFLTEDGYLRTWREGLGPGWNWSPAASPPSQPSEETEWRRFDELFRSTGRGRVFVEGSWDEIVPRLERNPHIRFQAVLRSPFESLIEMQPR